VTPPLELQPQEAKQNVVEGYVLVDDVGDAQLGHGVERLGGPEAFTHTPTQQPAHKVSGARGGEGLRRWRGNQDQA
jgi:hypothetical protein